MVVEILIDEAIAERETREVTQRIANRLVGLLGDIYHRDAAKEFASILGERAACRMTGRNALKVPDRADGLVYVCGVSRMLLDLALKTLPICQKRLLPLRHRGFGLAWRSMIAVNPDYMEWVVRASEEQRQEQESRHPRSEPHPTPKPGSQFVSNRDSSEMNCPKVWEAIGRAQAVPWRINPGLRELLVRQWDRGYPLPGIPGLEEPSATRRIPQREWIKLMKDRVRWRRDRWTCQDIQAAARAMPERFFYRWVVDFRGRYYPTGSPLSPQASDLARGLLEYADGEPIGDSAHHLARFGANCWGQGLSKTPYRQREKWVKDHTEDILKSAEYPESERFWWAAAEPWRFLAFCKEWAGYLKNGPEHITRMPCLVDATCSGGQMMALLMRDEELARTLNMTSRKAPNDIYLHIAKMVAEDLPARKHGPEWMKYFKGKVPRDVVKMATIAALVDQGYSARNVPQTAENWFWRQDDLTWAFGGAVVAPLRDLTMTCNAAARRFARPFGRLRAAVGEALKINPHPSWTAESGMFVNSTRMRREKRKGYYLMTNVVDTEATVRGVIYHLLASLESSILTDVIVNAPFHMMHTHDCFGGLAPRMDEVNRLVRESYITVAENYPFWQWDQEVTCGSVELEEGEFDLSQIRKAQYLVT